MKPIYETMIEIVVLFNALRADRVDLDKAPAVALAAQVLRDQLQTEFDFHKWDKNGGHDDHLYQPTG